MSQEFKKQRGHLVETIRITDITSSAPVKVHQVPEGAGIKIYPTSAGTASIYSTTAPRSISDGDNTNSEITTAGAADWDAWGAGDVTSSTTQKATVPVQTVACVVTSGTWVMEVSV